MSPSFPPDTAFFKRIRGETAILQELTKISYGGNEDGDSQVWVWGRSWGGTLRTGLVYQVSPTGKDGGDHSF